MSDQLVALFEGDSQGSGLRLLARTRDPQLVRQVRVWFADRQRADAAELQPRPHLIPDMDGDDDE